MLKGFRILQLKRWAEQFLATPSTSYVRIGCSSKTNVAAVSDAVSPGGYNTLD